MEFPRIRPLLDNYNFPDHILGNDYLDHVLSDKRIDGLREVIRNISFSNGEISNNCIEYIVPWNEDAIIEEGSVDMIISQSVLQAIDDLDTTYKMMSKWLKPGGLQSHDIGFKSCGSADTWYGHWGYSDFEWKIVRGRKSFFINREPYSTHINLLRKNNFAIVLEKKVYAETVLKRKKLSYRFRNMSDGRFINI